MRREKESIEAGARQQGKKETLKQGAFNFYITNPETLLYSHLMRVRLQSGCRLCVVSWELLLGEAKDSH